MSNTQYEDLLKHVISTGAHKSDRTGTGTTSVFGAQMRFDLSEGFPLITTKKVHTKSIIHELLWFLKGDTNIKYLVDNGVRIWNEWQDENGDLGPVYGSIWRNWYAPSNRMIQVDRRTDEDADYVYPYESTFYPVVECDLNSDEAWAIEDLGTVNKNRRYRIQLKSGYIGNVSRPSWKAGNLFDGYKKSVCQVGFLGRPIARNSTRLYELWYNMMARCYEPQHPSYALYGGAGVTVSPIWHSYEKFSETISRVPGYHRWNVKEAMDLDKDYFGSNVYGPSTTLFLSHEDNVSIRADGTLVEIQGERYWSIAHWAEGKTSKAWYAGTRWKAGQSYKGIAADEVKVIQPDEGKLWRKEIYIDQIQNVIEQIKTNPDSRRLIVSAWNVAELDKMALPPCHLLIQFYVADGKLSCQLYQRSADMFLGVPFNIASYALLTHMVAQQTGLDVGDFIWSGGDVHVYDNHREQVDLQLSREVRPFPQLNLRKADSIFDYTYEDFEIEGYDPHPPIKGVVAV